MSLQEHHSGIWILLWEGSIEHKIQATNNVSLVLNKYIL